ncbi:hypothetical protein KCU65_g9519, partial [Aureobasidium melanogenum]
MAEHTPSKYGPHTHLDAMQDLDHAAATVPEDIIRQVNDFKAKNVTNDDKLLKIRLNANKHIFECSHYNLQINQHRLVFAGGSPLIHACPDGSINNFNSRKIYYAIKLLEFDRKKADALSAFYAVQKQYFKLIEEMKNTEIEIQQLLSGLEQDDKEEDDEMQASRKRFTLLEDNRVQMMEGWLDWLAELS